MLQNDKAQIQQVQMMFSTGQNQMNSFKKLGWLFQKVKLTKTRTHKFLH